MTTYTFTSSANNFTDRKSPNTSKRSFIYNRKRSGLRTLPWGSLLMTKTKDDKLLPISWLVESYLINNFEVRTLSPKPNASSLDINFEWHTLSKAFEKSICNINTTQIFYRHAPIVNTFKQLCKRGMFWKKSMLMSRNKTILQEIVKHFLLYFPLFYNKHR